MGTVAFVLVLAVANAQLLSPKFTQFMQLKEQAGNAVDAVMDVLNGLRQSALDERAALDVSHVETEAAFAKRIGDLTAIMNTNRGIYDATIANREFVEDDIVYTANYIEFINNRFAQIAALVAELQDERCDASLIFVTRCREHYEALTAVDLLKQDLQDWEAAGMPVSLAQIKELPSFNKLSAYTNLFKRQALDNFLSLADDRMTRRSSEEIGDDHVDNAREAQVLEHQESTRDNTEQTVIGKLMVRLDEFVLHLELDRYMAYAAKLENDIVLAQDMEAKAKKTWEDSVAAVEQAKVELQEHRDWYMAEVDRLRNDVEVVDEVIAIFLQELQGIDDIIRNQQYDEAGVVDDDRFSQGMFRNTDTDAGEYTGQANWEGAVDARGL